MPGSSICLSLPPWKRYKADNILVNFVMQDGLSSEAQKKFFDKIFETDLEPLFTEGVKDSWGNKVRVEVFVTVRNQVLASPHRTSTSRNHHSPPPYILHTIPQCMDLKGREKFLNQISVKSYTGCSFCRAVFPQGCGGPCFGITRKFLPADHPLRNTTFGRHNEFQYTAAERSGIVSAIPLGGIGWQCDSVVWVR